MAKEYDLVIVGGGTGGYVAAIRASQLGMKTAIVEANKLGGTCLHKGCIPSKALLRSAEVYATLKDSQKYGLIAEQISYDYAKIQQRKDEIINQLYKGVQGLIQRGKIDVYQGYGRIMGPSIFSPMAGTISVEKNEGGENEMLVPKHVLIATGSKPKSLPGLQVDGQFVITSDEALELTSLPRSMIIVGGGVIGVEWASLLSDFGVQVTIIESEDRLLPLEDRDIGREMSRLLKKREVKVVTEAKVLPESLQQEADTLTIAVERHGKIESYQSEKLLLSVGRQPNSKQIGLENTEIQVEQGWIKVNENFQTKEAHMYAIGDVIGGLQLAHVAAREGIIAVEHMAGHHPEPMDIRRVPRCIYSRPEVASIGLTEEEAIDQGYQVKAAKFPFQAIGKALVYGERDGFVKIIADQNSQDVLGIHMLGPQVTNMISEAGLAMLLDATPWELGESIHPHPSLSEALGEAALMWEGKPIHI